MSALPEPQRFNTMPRSHEWGFCLPELLLLVQLDPINGSDTAINQLLAAPLCSPVFLVAVKPGIGSELTPSALSQNLVFRFCPRFWR